MRKIRQGSRYFGLGVYQTDGEKAQHYVGLWLVEIPVGKPVKCIA